MKLFKIIWCVLYLHHKAGGGVLVLAEDKNSEETEIPSFRLKPSAKTEV